jgi:hypothetical protein
MSSTPESQLPDPEGPPAPSEHTRKTVAQTLSTGFVVVAGGIAAFLVLATLATPTMGAARSQRIKWEQRRREIAQAQADLARAADDATTPQPGEAGHD